jgi:TetR/AcrR family transcriptional regulator, transcriptional repressor for nem operon
MVIATMMISRMIATSLFSDRTEFSVTSGCPLLNTAIDSDDGNPRLREKARRALSSWLERLRSIIEEGQRRGEIRGEIDSAELATLIVSTLEGTLMVSRLQRKDDPRDWASRHLEEYLETNVRAARQKPGENR